MKRALFILECVAVGTLVLISTAMAWWNGAAKLWSAIAT